MKKNILIIILAVIALGLGIFVVIDKVSNKPTTECDCHYKTTEESETIDDSTSEEEQDRWHLDMTIDQNTVKIVNKLAEERPDLGMSKEATLTFDKNVKSIFEGVLSNNMGTVYFFLMEDGTVEYMRYSDIYLRNNYTHNTIAGVTDVVKLEQVDPYDEEGNATINKVLAYKSDGTAYNLNDYNLLAGDGVDR